MMPELTIRLVRNVIHLKQAQAFMQSSEVSKGCVLAVE